MNEHARNLSADETGSLIEMHLENGVLTLQLADPPAHTLSVAMITQLHEALNDAASNRDVSVVVIASSGKIFCAGHDFKGISDHVDDDDGGRAYLEDLFKRSCSMMAAITQNPKPVIAAVDGIATAAGCQMVASCDLAIATENAQFCTPGVNVGSFCATPMVALSRSIAPKHAMEMLLTGEMIDAQTAREFGLVNRVVPQDYLAQTVTKYAETIASKSSVAIALGKPAFYKQLEMPLKEAYAYSSDVMVEGFLTPDSNEGVSAFLEKREPKFTGGS